MSTSVKRFEKQLSSKRRFCPFLQLNCSYFIALTVPKALELPKMSNNLSLKKSGTSYYQKRISSDNHLQNI